ncbi:MAG: hypothetical protein KA035_02765 [Candidatus Levybacteria bacterium]|nr:hypothetical protein [Candidatus Levybacteria bacterium]
MYELKLALFGFITGILSIVLSPGIFTIFLFPGAIYGLFLGLYFYPKNRIDRQKANNIFIFTVLSAIAYLVASLGIGFLNNNLLEDIVRLGPEIDDMPVLSLILSGLVGSAILLGAFHFYIKRITVGQYVRLVLLGGVLGLTWYAIPSGTIFPSSGGISSPTEGIFAVLVFWQMGMTMGIGLFTRQSEGI